MSYNLKSIKEQFKAKGIFYTPPELALYMKSLVDIDGVKTVYDPTCGDGSLLAVFGDDVAKYGQELNDHQLDVANDRLVNFTGVCGDTLASPAFIGMKFDLIMANPPFSIKWEPPILGDMFNDDRWQGVPDLPPKSRADYAFILHILHYLRDDGVAVVLNSPGICYRGQREGKIRQWLVEKNLIEKVIRVPPKTFTDTTIETVIVIFRKNKPTTDITFSCKESGESVVVSKDSVAANDFNLSVNLYLHKEEEKEEIDARKLNDDARKRTIQQLLSDLDFDRMVCQIEGWSHVEYIDQIMNKINGYRNNLGKL